MSKVYDLQHLIDTTRQMFLQTTGFYSFMIYFINIRLMQQKNNLNTPPDCVKKREDKVKRMEWLQQSLT